MIIEIEKDFVLINKLYKLKTDEFIQYVKDESKRKNNKLYAYGGE
jgi:hypothetical protein